MIEDLSYAAKGPEVGNDKPRMVSLIVKGWGIGWALFEGQEPQSVGHVRVRDHFKGKAVPVYHRALAAYTAVGKIAAQFRARTVVADTPRADGPLWSLPAALALMIGATYADVPRWQDRLDKTKEELRGWATLIMGKAPEDELESQALGVGAAALAQARESEPSLVDMSKPQ